MFTYNTIYTSTHLKDSNISNHRSLRRGLPTIVNLSLSLKYGKEELTFQIKHADITRQYHREMRNNSTTHIDIASMTLTWLCSAFNVFGLCSGSGRVGGPGGEAAQHE